MDNFQIIQCNNIFVFIYLFTFHCHQVAISNRFQDTGP